MTDWITQRYFEDVREGDEVPPVTYNLTIQHLVIAAGANRDFNLIHHNSRAAQKQGAPDMFASNTFVQGMWERVVWEYIGLDGRIKKLGPFRIKTFNSVGESVVTKGKIGRKWQQNAENLVELEVWSEHSKGISVGPGPVLVTLPSWGCWSRSECHRDGTHS